MHAALQHPDATQLFESGLDLREARIKSVRGPNGFARFCIIYLPHYFPLTPPEFMPELIAALEDDTVKRLLEIGFRGSAKSAITSMAYILYAALVKPALYPFIIPIADTGTQATAVISAIKHEFESNELLREDFGKITFTHARDKSHELKRKLETREEWQARNLLLSTGVRILARSRWQRIRGLRHRQHRPKLIIGDDVENLDAVATQEKRDKTAKWWQGEVLGAIAQDARVILVGNWLHLDGLLARMKANGLYKVLEFSLLRDTEGTDMERCVWPELYPTQKALDDKRTEMGEIAWRREMLLQVVPDEGQDVLPEDIHYYDDPPFDDGNYLAHGVDPAISTKQSADPTAVVSAEVAWPDRKLQLFIQQHPVNKRMTFTESMEVLDQIRGATHHAKTRKYERGMILSSNEAVHDDGFVYASYTMSSEFYVEAVAFQQVMIEEMERRAFSVQPMHPIKDKRSRLRVAARYIKNGTVKFPRKGCELLIQQLLGFGIEKHDDLVDALVYLILGVVEGGTSPQEIQYV